MELQNLQTISAHERLPETSVLSRNTIVAVAGLIIILIAILAITIGFAPAPKKPNNNLAAAATITENAFSNIHIEAQSAIVIDLRTEKVLFEQSPDAQLPLASLTKIALVLAISEVLSPETTVTIPRDITSPMGVRLFSVGEEWRIQDIIDATLVTSSNNGAELLAEVADSGIRDRFSLGSEEHPTLWRMNDIARDLGMAQSYFLNVSGLDISTTLAGAYGSARDMATLFAHIAKSNSGVFSGTARGGTLLTSVNGRAEVTAENTNESESVIPGLIMGKTGFTDLAGGNLAVVFDVGIGRPVVAVVLGSSVNGRFKDIQRLVNASREYVASETF